MEILFLMLFIFLKQIRLDWSGSQKDRKEEIVFSIVQSHVIFSMLIFLSISRPFFSISLSLPYLFCSRKNRIKTKQDRTKEWTRQRMVGQDRIEFNIIIQLREQNPCRQKLFFFHFLLRFSRYFHLDLSKPIFFSLFTKQDNDRLE